MIDRSDLQHAVYDVVRLIPKGRATSYGAIARAIGYPNHSRLVGKVMNGGSMVSEGLPAHRVVNSQGELVGKDSFGSSSEMQDLLQADGIEVVNNRIRNWKRVFWNPIKELDMLETD